MALSHEHVGSKILAKIKIYILSRAELLCTLCNEIPCIRKCLYFADLTTFQILGRAEIYQIFSLVFWKIQDTKKTF
jgi:hypothetical protein